MVRTGCYSYNEGLNSASLNHVDRAYERDPDTASGDGWGGHMKNGIATHSLHHECYVLRIDGPYRRFVDALRAGLKLKDRFPDHDIKVAVKQTEITGNSTEEIMQRTVLH